MDFGSQMRVMRAARKLSQLELAQVTGIPNTYLSNIETGLALPNADWESRIRVALRWPPRADEAFALLEEEVVYATSE